MLKNGEILCAEGRDYIILEQLGRGASCAAYLAECRQNDLVTKCILKEYAPLDQSDFERGKQRFIDSGRQQNSIRQLGTLTNQTPPVSHIFEANGTAFIDVSCYNGTTLDKLSDLTLPQYMAICLTLAKTVSCYHKAGYLCLDLKPENLFVLQNPPEDTITQLVECIDFDSIRDRNHSGNMVFPYTREWAAPEQLNPYSIGKISNTADIFTVGEIIFYLLFGRHSTDTEHRGFSKFPFEDCKHEYQTYTARPDVQALLIRIFRGTIRSSASNRFQEIGELTALLEQLVTALNQKDYVIPILPSVSPDFVGRDTELRRIAESLQQNPVLYVTGIGGIGKSTLIKNYLARYRTEYEVIVYLEYDGDLQHTFCDDMQLQLSTVSRQDGEPLSAYFPRKMSHFMRICGDKRVLFVVDNFSGKITKDLSRIIDCGYDTIIATRNRPPKNSFAVLEIGAIADTAELFRLIALNLERTPTKAERLCFEEIIALVQGHTLVLELIARQIAAGRLDIHTALELIRENGFSRFSGEKVGNYKDGEEVYDTLSAIISALFDASAVSAAARLTLKILALLNVHGLESSLVQQFFPEIQLGTVSLLSAEGWLYDGHRVRLHPVIAETVRNWEWTADDVTVMDYHRKMIDIYVGMANDLQIWEILREAERYSKQHPRHIITAMYYDMLAAYYDTLLNGNYVPYTDDEQELLQELTDAMEIAIEELEQSTDIHAPKLLVKYNLSSAGILIRSLPEYHCTVKRLLTKAETLLEANEPECSENRCYFCMISAWYYTLAEVDIAQTRALTKQAERIAKQVFPTDLEIIDIIHIPTANCFYYHDDLRSAADKIEEAVELCKGYPDMLPYIDKQAELLNILLDIYIAMEDTAKCRELIAEIDCINATYKEQGVCREVKPEIREKAGS